LRDSQPVPENINRFDLVLSDGPQDRASMHREPLSEIAGTVVLLQRLHDSHTSQAIPNKKKKGPAKMSQSKAACKAGMIIAQPPRKKGAPHANGKK